MGKFNYIPRGAKVIADGKTIAKVARDIRNGEIPTEAHFIPPIANGTNFKDFQFTYNGKVIYHHPNFIEFDD